MIDVRMPFSTSGNLGQAYNEAMDESKAKWVLLMDQDVLPMHPNWYSMLCKAIEIYPDAGLMTCYVSKIGSVMQQHVLSPPNVFPITAHRVFGKNLWQTSGMNATAFTVPSQHVSGCFMLVRKQTWKELNGFKNGFFGVDWNFTKKVFASRWKIYRLNGLYVYHLRWREPAWLDGAKVSLDFNP